MKRLKTTAAYAFLALIAASGAYAYSQSTLCAVVKLEIQQQATLEREAFDAHLAVSNNLPTTPLTNFKVQIFFKDANGNSADSLFFVKIGTLTNINAIDGTGVVQSSTTADIHWLIIPSTGAGGSTPAGQQYSVSALITGVSNGAPQSVTTFNASITVQPQPLINLQYVLPYEVFADEPLTPIIEPIEPFPLGVRVTNVGFGTANNFQINSAQPQIVENKQGLAIDFTLLGTIVSSQTIPNTLLIPFGNVPPNGVVQAQWIMATTLSGRFISFTSTFTHAADLGGQLTSLLQSVTTYTLLHAVQVDLPGRDSTPDFLVNESMDRGSMQALLDGGTQPPAEALLESDQPNPLTVTEIPGALAGTLSGTNGSLTYAFTQGVSSNVWVHSYALFSYGNSVALSYVRRGDGKILNSHNAWVSKHFNKTTLSDIYWINILDLTTTTNTYTLQFSSAGLDVPPAAVANLNAVTVSSGGSINLSWTAPGDGGNTGNILGGRYLIETVQSTSAAVAPTFAQVDIATSTAPGNLENLIVTGLVGNATFQAYLWTQNTGGDISPISNGTTVYSLPNPPTGLVFTTVGSSFTAASWQLGNNNLPILYQISAATAPGGVAVSSSPGQDSFTRSYVFTGLSPLTTYYYSGIGYNPVTGSSSPPTFLGAAQTGPAPIVPTINPAFGVGGSAFSITGVNFGVYAGTASTRVQFGPGGPVASISSWNNSKISGVIPALSTGTYAVLVERQTGVSVSTIAAGTFTVGNVNASSGPAVSLSPFDGDEVTLSTHAIVASYTDSTAAISTASVTLALDGVDVTTRSSVTSSAITYIPTAALSEGTHTVTASVADAAAYVSTASATFLVDTIAPVTSLTIDGSVAASTAPVVVSTDALGFSAFDAGSGAVDTVYIVDADLNSCDFSNYVSTAPAGTCANPYYSAPFTLSAGTHTLSFYSDDDAGNSEDLNIVSVRVLPAPSPLILTLSPANGSFVAESFPALAALYVDGVAAVDTTTVRLSLDGVDVTTLSVVGVSSASFVPVAAVVDGTHTVAASAADFFGNVSTAAATFLVDTVPPVTSLAIDSQTVAAGSYGITSTDTVSLSATDAGSGVSDIFFVVDADPFSDACEGVPLSTSAPNGTCANEAYNGAFTLSTGTHVLYYFSEDLAGNQEAENVSTFTVISVGAPPALTVASISPASATSGRTLSAGVTGTGFDASAALSLEHFRVAAGTWTTGASLATARQEPASVLLRDGRVLTAGGFNASGTALSSAELFDPVAGTWSPAATMHVAVYSGIMVVLNNGQVLYAGGQAGSTSGADTTLAELYDPVANTWTATGPLLTAVNQAMSALLPDGRVLLAGGYSTATGQQQSGVQLYDPVAGTWSAGPAMSVPRDIGAATLLKNGRVLVAGGSASGGATAIAQLFDGPTNSWLPAGSMLAARYAQGQALLSDGRVIAAGGDQTGVSLASSELYDPATNAWTAGPNLSVARDFSQQMIAVDGRALAVGGGVAGGFNGTVEAYEPSANVWRPSAPLIAPVANAPVLQLNDGRVLVVGGSGGSDASLVTEALTQVLTMPVTAVAATGVSVADAQHLSGSLNLAGAATGYWDVVVREAGNRIGRLSAGFQVTSPVVSPYAIVPATGPIGVPFTITGPGGFGSYAGGNTTVLIGASTAPLSNWSDASISGSIPGLSTGTYPVFVRIQGSSSATFTSVGSFGVVPLTAAALTPSTGPIGIPFTFSGVHFGPYAGGQTQFLFDGTAATLSAWNDTAITGTVPNLSSGTHAAWAERLTSDGGVSVSATSYFTVTTASITSISPSSGPIGATFALTGQSFGVYAGGLTQVLFGGTTVTLSAWNDTSISGVVPGGFAAGTYPVVVERQTSDGGLTFSSTAYFQVLGVRLNAITPSTGPIGIPFALSGSGFGAFDGGNTNVLLGGTTATISAWSDSSIAGTIPALSTGAYPVYVTRTSGSSTVSSCVSTFTVTALVISTPTPASGPVGAAFTLTGSGFGVYAGGNTQVLIGGATVPLSVWNDNQISGTVPTLSSGTQPLWIERFSGSGLETSDTVYFQITAPAIASISPSSGPIGIAYTLTGSGFGAYAGGNTQVLIGGTTTALSLWNETTIQGTIPGSLSAGTYNVQVERIGPDGGVILSTSASFQVTAPSVAGISPSSGAIGVPFTITGTGFGTYNGSNTQILVGGVSATLSTWNDSTIAGSIPALASGTYSVSLQRQEGVYLSSTFVSSFTVVVPIANSVAPSSAPIGASFSVSGTGFGPYAGGNTLVLVGGATAQLSVWNDTLVSGTVPGALSAFVGTTTIVVERIVGSSVVTTSLPFYVELPAISTLTPNFGPDGTGVSIMGTGFGPYAGANTQLLLNGTTVPLAVWNDTNIVWTVPDGFPDGTYPLIVQLTPSDGGAVQSSSVAFTVGTSYGGLSFAAAAPLASHPDWYFAGGMNLPATQDTRILTPSLAAVTVSSGSLAKDTVLTVANARALYAADRATALAHAGMGAAGEAISFGPEGTQFAHPVTIQLPYDPNLVSPGQASGLSINYYDPAAKAWTPLLTTVDTTRHLLSAKTSHFSLYQPLGSGIGVASAAQDAFGLRTAYVFPNPVRGTSQVTIRIEPGLADSVEVRVYDVTGRRVHSSTAFNFTNGNDPTLGAQDIYDHVWDVSGVGSGVYTYVITAKKAGQADIHASGRIGVVK